MRTALLALLLSAAAAMPAAAHTRLERSSPADGDTLTAPPRELRLVFSQAVAPQYTLLLLRGPDGAVIDTPPLATDAERRAYHAAAPPLHAAGRYTIEWRTTAADGHVITGTFTFVFAPDYPNSENAAAGAGATLPSGPPPRYPNVGERTGTPTGSSAAASRHPDTRDQDSALLPEYLQPAGAPAVLTRALLFAALLGVIGLAAFRTVVLRQSDLPAEARAAVLAALRRFGLAVVTLLLLALALRLWLQSAALHGPGRALDGGLVASLLLDLGWGRAWLLQLTAAVLALLGVSTGFTALLALAAVVLAFTPALQGHAAAVESAPTLALAADGAHVLAAGAWIGALAVLLLAAVPALRSHAAGEYAKWVRQLVHRFSPLALAAVGLLGASGVVSALLHVSAPSDLYGTEYGRMLLLKLFFVALVLGAGWYNWRRARPRMENPMGVAALYRSATLELLLAGAALAATAALVALPTP